MTDLQQMAAGGWPSASRRPSLELLQIWESLRDFSILQVETGGADRLLPRRHTLAKLAGVRILTRPLCAEGSRQAGAAMTTPAYLSEGE